jgi:putative PIN family toxin of toxin-antitoxin system
MKRVVFDTNTLISGIFWGGAPNAAWLAALDQRFILLTSDALLSEFRVVVSREKFGARLKAQNETVDGLLAKLTKIAVRVEPADLPPIIKADPKDDMIVMCAVGGKADLIISGDHHLLDLGAYEDIAIVTVNVFLEMIAES